METKIVKDFMVPLSEYATVSKDATLVEALVALKKAQTEYDPNRYRHRAVLIYDETNTIIGKLSFWDVLRSLEPKYEEMLSDSGPLHVGFTRKYMQKMIEQLNLWEEPLENLCQKAGNQTAQKSMVIADEREIIEASASLNEAIHLFILGHHTSLFVAENGKIIGILKVADVFEAVSEAIMACDI